MHNTWTVPHVPTGACPVLHVQHMCDVHTMTCTLLHVQYSTPCTCSKAWLGRSHGKCLSESRLEFCTWNHPEFWFFKAKGGYNGLEYFDYLKPWVVVSGKSNVWRIIKLPVKYTFEWFKCTTTVEKTQQNAESRNHDFLTQECQNHKKSLFQIHTIAKNPFHAPCQPQSLPIWEVQSRVELLIQLLEKKVNGLRSLLKVFDIRFVFVFEIVPPAFLPIVKNQPCWTLKSTSIHSWLLKKMMMMWLSWSFRKNSSAWS